MGSLEISVIGLAPPCGRIQGGGGEGAEFSCIKFVEPAVATCLWQTLSLDSLVDLQTVNKAT